MICPKCKGQFNVLSISGIEASKCDGCGAILFRHGTHDKARHIPEAVARDSHVEVVRGSNEIRDIDCPECHSRMTKMIDKAQHHIQFEACSYCDNVLFDAGEFKDFSENTLVERIKQVMSIFKYNMSL